MSTNRILSLRNYGPAGTGNLESECLREGTLARTSESSSITFFGYDLDPQAQVFSVQFFWDFM